MHLYGDAQGAGDRAENPQLRKSGHFASPLTLPTAALFAAYFFGLDAEAAFVLCGLWGVLSIFANVASRRATVSSSE